MTAIRRALKKIETDEQAGKEALKSRRNFADRPCP
jgi:hypothetical protein